MPRRRKSAPRLDFIGGNIKIPPGGFFRSLQPKTVRIALRLDAGLGRFLRNYARDHRLSVTEAIVRALLLLQSSTPKRKTKDNGRKK